MTNLTKIVSGGQTGVDQAALRAAQDCGLESGGWCPPGHACDSGTIPARFPLRETPRERSADAPDIARSLRTEWNVRDSDATLVLRPGARHRPDPGTDWAEACAARFGRPLLVCDLSDPGCASRIEQWLHATGARVLNVAGPSERDAPGSGDQVYRLLVSLLS
jgi:hypothetical protein